MPSPGSQNAQDSAIGTTVGIVVIGRNEGSRLVECLASLRTHIDHVVYVDSGSTDGSTIAARRAGAQVVELDPSQPFSAARGRNAGFDCLMRSAPDCEYVQFIDGDCRLDPDWIETASRFLLMHPHVAIVCGRRREQLPDRSVYNAMCDEEWNGPVGEIRECGGDFLARSEAFRKVGGFDAGLIAGEEPELCVRLRERGWRIWRLAAAMTQHDANILQFSQWWRRTVRGGHAFAEVAALHRASPQRIWQRNVQRACFWGGLVPATFLMATTLGSASLLVLVLYPVQWARLVVRSGDYSRAGITKAGLLVVGKLAEFQGIAIFHARRLLRRGSTILEYK